MSNLTKKALRETMIKALNERPLDKIKVKELVEECGVNRNTFYYHYKDIYELLADIFKTETEAIAEDFQDEDDDWERIFIESSRFALENKKMIFNVYNSISRDNLERYLYNVSTHIVARYVNKQAVSMNVSERDKELIILFYKHAVVGIVLEWLQRRMKDEPEAAISRLLELMNNSVKNALKNAETK
ncbi:TetR family transcriptional regulator [Eubacterium sulci ATCC 35585]|nr:TetR family transcriptional regulator [Eubacterium sulci ATCC 35585]EUC77625.1 transcriptional regulator, TetR family [Eubacterium sulci ATCC 35585]